MNINDFILAGKLAGSGGGGGGSSDFSTAEITLKASTIVGVDPPQEIYTNIPVIYNGSFEPLYLPFTEGTKITIPLYKGSTAYYASRFIDNIADDNGVPDISGDIEFIETDLGYLFVITGNCELGLYTPR